jgi:cellulose synthase/poly-beta-1,6-N-acetylglucosamine synthase-like glycosyltransferase/spore germination protein YaaH/peptidoglycan/xylan/chitin deacetylase (PgdA/CDA1 family)
MSKQVFQSHSDTRWNRFVWAVRIFLVLLIIAVVSVIFSLFHSGDYSAKALLIGEKRIHNINNNPKAKKVSESEIVSFVKRLKEVRKHHKKDFYKQAVTIPNDVKAFLPVRAGFYVNWDKSSAVSLKENISKLNMVIPEWLFLKDSKGNLDIRVDKNIVDLLHQNKVAIVPLISNNYNNRWNGDTTLVLLKNKESRANLIKNIKEFLDEYEFQGINLDFESLPAAAAPYFNMFSKELSATLSKDNYMVTMDINPAEFNLDIKQIGNTYDLIFVMAYDEHNADGAPGCIASVGFIENSLDNLMKSVPSNKFVLCAATYGYNWIPQKNAKDLSYEQFISLANEKGAQVSFDPDNSDLFFKYYNEDGKVCEAHCNDAVSVFNALRTAADYGTSGVALWYLGSEDYRIWDFFGRDMSVDGLTRKPYNFARMERIKSMYSVNYDGIGELLEVISKPENGIAKLNVDKSEFFISNEKYVRLPSSYLINRYGGINPKRIALSFDDGPDGEYTPQILDILKAKKIHASFFVTGLNVENNIPLLKRLYREGHEIGNHTFLHPNLEITSDDRERIELRSTRMLLESVLGHTTMLFRTPYNTDAQPHSIFQIKPLSIAYEEGYISVASSIDPNDWQKGVCADTIVARAIAQQKMGNILLLHDSGGERSQTVLALPRIIDYFQKQGYQFVTVSELMGKTRDQVMPPVKSHIFLTEDINGTFFFLTFLWQHFIRGFFFVAIGLGILRLLSLLVMAFLQRRKQKKAKQNIDSTYQPKVSIIVPAYNEEVNAVRTIQNLLKCTYGNFDVVFIDDGSKDSTYTVVKDAFEGNARVKVLTKPNGGKASALNYAIGHTDSEILVCIDADTLLMPDAVEKMVPFFADSTVGAVAGNVRVGNPVNMLTSWQRIEYNTSQNFDRRAFDYVNAILVVPGAIGAFRHSVMKEIDGFDTDTLAEDCDLTVRILRKGYTVRSCNEALSLTEAPESLKMFVKQRFRWSFGMMQTFWKHRDLLFTHRKPNMGWILLPNLLIFGFIIPVFSPLVDIMFIFGLFTPHVMAFVLSYVLFYVVELLIAMVAYSYDNLKFGPREAALLFVQRFVYRQILFVVLIKAYLKAIKGELASWGVLKRTGNVHASVENS